MACGLWVIENMCMMFQNLVNPYHMKSNEKRKSWKCTVLCLLFHVQKVEVLNMNRKSVHNISVRDFDIRKVVCACAHACVCMCAHACVFVCAKHFDAGLKLKGVKIFMIFFNELEKKSTF
jgi:hypothetical protein